MENRKNIFNLENLLKSYPEARKAIETKTIRLVRHSMKDWPGFNKILRFDKNMLKIFTAEHRRDIFKNTRLILAFVPHPGGNALLSGAFINNGPMSHGDFINLHGYTAYSLYRKNIGLNNISPAKYKYELEVCDELKDLFDRLIINWGGSTRSWCQNKVDKDITQVLPDGFVMEFPGWDRVHLTHQELKMIIEKPEANIEWYEFLSGHDGVYLILDEKTGYQYVGSATGENGLWGRWRGYAQTAHNGNKSLKDLISKTKEKEDYAYNFKYSIHHVFAKSSNSGKAALHFESLLKKKMGSRAFGLNLN